MAILTVEFTVTVELERDSGKFISKDELAEFVQQSIEDADPSQVDVDESSYSVVGWSVDRK